MVSASSATGRFCLRSSARLFDVGRCDAGPMRSWRPSSRELRALNARGARLLFAFCCEFDATRANLRYSLVVPKKKKRIMEETVEVVRLIPQECLQRTVEEMVDVPASQFQERFQQHTMGICRRSRVAIELTQSANCDSAVFSHMLLELSRYSVCLRGSNF